MLPPAIPTGGDGAGARPIAAAGRSGQ
jgi:hypothetical protein